MLDEMPLRALHALRECEVASSEDRHVDVSRLLQEQTARRDVDNSGEVERPTMVTRACL